jgi:hypothetical protein
MQGSPDHGADWPEFPYRRWWETGEALHLWTQIVGKVRLALTPWLNHSWHVPFYVTARGLSTGVIFGAKGPLDLEFDFISGKLRIRTAAAEADLPLEPMSVAEFYARVMRTLEALGEPVSIYAAPNELPEATPFPEDRRLRAYDGAQALRFFRALLQADRVLKQFRTAFLGKASPVHFFWGSFDLAATRFSGRRAPLHPGGAPHLPDAVTREAYSHEVSSAGFWPGGPGCEEAVFYAYAYPEPQGFSTAAVEPGAARYDPTLREFVLPYEAVRTAADPDQALTSFLSATYAAAADAGGWDRANLECDFGEIGRPRLV